MATYNLAVINAVRLVLLTAVVYVQMGKSLVQRRAPLGLFKGTPRPRQEHFENKMVGNAMIISLYTFGF